jgi:hypothetical protein
LGDGGNVEAMLGWWSRIVPILGGKGIAVSTLGGIIVEAMSVKVEGTERKAVSAAEE